MNNYPVFWRTGAVRPAVDLFVSDAGQSLFGHEARRQVGIAVQPRASRPRCSTHLYVAASVGPVPAGATTGGLHQDATEHLLGAFMALRRACPGGSTTCGPGACQLNRCSRRDRPGGERDILLAVVANQL